ncbi:hypothetical protein V8B97DRAFT_2026674 [Scleroderma yunnanense]
MQPLGEELRLETDESNRSDKSDYEEDDEDENLPHDMSTGSASNLRDHVQVALLAFAFHTQKQAVLAWAKTLGATNVSSLYGLQKTFANILKLLGNPAEQFTVPSGNTFYLNVISKAIAMDFSNPLSCLTIQDGQGHMSQVHHGQTMLEELPEGLVPPSIHQSSKQYFIPKKFFQAKLGPTSETEVLALGHKVFWTEVGFAVDLEQIITPVSTFSQTFEDITSHPTEVAVSFTVKSGEKMVLTVPLIIFMNDVSRNEFCVQFVCSSPHAAPLELVQGVKKSIQEAAESGIITWDCKYEEGVMVISYDHFHGGDNPMQAEECSHGGLKCNHFCQTCKVGGTNVEKRTDKEYTDLFTTPEETLAEIKKQVRLSMLSGDTTKIKAEVSKTGTHDAVTALIIEHLLELGKCLRKCKTGTAAIPKNEVCTQLQQELDALLGDSVETGGLGVMPMSGGGGIDLQC